MTDIVERLRWCPEYGGWSDAVVLMPEAADEIERLRATLQRIDGINDNPACYNPMIDEVLRRDDRQRHRL